MYRISVLLYDREGWKICAIPQGIYLIRFLDFWHVLWELSILRYFLVFIDYAYGLTWKKQFRKLFNVLPNCIQINVLSTWTLLNIKNIKVKTYWWTRTEKTDWLLSQKYGVKRRLFGYFKQERKKLIDKCCCL